jgi:hypothetical protein
LLSSFSKYELIVWYAIGRLPPSAEYEQENQVPAGLPVLRDTGDRVVVGEPDEFSTRLEPNIQGAGAESFATQS